MNRVLFYFRPKVTYYRYYSLVSSNQDIPSASVRTHRRQHYWQLLTKEYISFLGIRIPIWKWDTFDEYRLVKDMKKDCEQDGLKLINSTPYDMKPHDYNADENSSLAISPLRKMNAA